MSDRSESEDQEQSFLDEWLARAATRDTLLERMARAAIQEHRQGTTEYF
ncbi:hypothetical protein [Rhodovibrio sodomensis]|nr:hypothetical protein [Rhodovibrio sodomensis]